jgi:hypothetical protein
MKRFIILFTVLLIGINSNSFAQVYYTKNGRISFFSKTSLENINADNNQAISVLNIQTGVLQFSILNNAFQFPRAKMEEDFKENYIESDKYPKSTFKGSITDISNINSLKNIITPATITIKDGKISATTSFKILIKDYNIRIPTIVTNKIAESIEISVSCNYEKK